MAWMRAAPLLLGLLLPGCANPALERARTRLYLSRIRLHTVPFFVIEGDEVTARVPIQTTPSCPFSAVPSREGRSISIRTVDEKPCPISAEVGSTVVGIRLGALPAGDYTLHAGALEHTFTVHPPETPVGPVPERWRVAIAVVERFEVERCEGDDPPMGVSTPPERVRRAHPLVFRQVRGEYPTWDEDRIADLVDRASYVEVLAVGDKSFQYIIQAGLCCTRGCPDGRAHLQESGHIEIGGR